MLSPALELKFWKYYKACMSVPWFCTKVIITRSSYLYLSFPNLKYFLCGHMHTWFYELSFRGNAIIKIHIFLSLHCVLCFLDYLDSNGNVLPSHLRPLCNWEKNSQTPLVYSISLEEENRKFKNCWLWIKQRLKAFLILLHFWSRICSGSRDSILANKYTIAGLSFVFQGYE